MKKIFLAGLVLALGCNEPNKPAATRPAPAAEASAPAPTLSDSIAPKVQAYLQKKGLDNAGYKPGNTLRLAPLTSGHVAASIAREFAYLKAQDPRRFKTYYGPGFDKFKKDMPGRDTAKVEGYIVRHTYTVSTGAGTSEKTLYMLCTPALYVGAARPAPDFTLADYGHVAFWSALYGLPD